MTSFFLHAVFLFMPLLLLSCIIFPSVTTTIFGMYNCVDIDPNAQIPGTPTYMSQDYSIACNSPRYTFGLVWASVGILVYPIGVLSLYAYCLWSNKDDIIKKKTAEVEERESRKEEALRQELEKREKEEVEDTDETVRLKKDLAVLTVRRRSSVTAAPLITTAVVPRIVGATELTFLYRAYKSKVVQCNVEILSRDVFSFLILSLLSSHIISYNHMITIKYWYWEIIETGRRLLLSAVLSVVNTGSTGQIVFGIALSLFYMRLYAYYQPYDLDEHCILQVRVYLTMAVVAFVY